MCPFFQYSVSQPEITDRVLAVCKAFEKLTADGLTAEAHFMKVTGGREFKFPAFS